MVSSYLQSESDSENGKVKCAQIDFIYLNEMLKPVFSEYTQTPFSPNSRMSVFFCACATDALVCLRCFLPLSLSLSLTHLVHRRHNNTDTFSSAVLNAHVSLTHVIAVFTHSNSTSMTIRIQFLKLLPQHTYPRFYLSILNLQRCCT